MIKLMDLLNEYKINKPITTKVIEYGEDVMKEIENLGLFNFDEGLLGSTNWGAGYYSYYEGKDARDFAGPFNKVKNKLTFSTLDKDKWDEEENNPNAINEFFNKYKGTYIVHSDYDDTNCGRIDVNPSDQTITIYVLPDNEEGKGLLQFNNNGSEVLVVPNFTDYTI